MATLLLLICISLDPQTSQVLTLGDINQHSTLTTSNHRAHHHHHHHPLDTPNLPVWSQTNPYWNKFPLDRRSLLTTVINIFNVTNSTNLEPLSIGHATTQLSSDMTTPKRHPSHRKFYTPNVAIFNNNSLLTINSDLKTIYPDYLTISSANSSNSHAEYSDLTQIGLVQIIFVLLYALVMFSALVGNLLVGYTVLSNRKMQTVVNCYIVNLALCDFLISVFVLPSKLMELLAPAEWSALDNVLCTVMLFLQTVVVFASVLTLVATCFERYVFCNISTNLKIPLN